MTKRKKADALPKTISIAGLEYKVVLKPILIGEGGDVLYGQADISRCEIEIAKNDGRGAVVPDAMRRQTLWHEVLHCVLEMSGDRHLSEDEAFVTRVSNLLHQALG